MVKDPITGHGKDPKYYYDDEMAECSCIECKKYGMCWPREMFGVGRPDNLRGCSMLTLVCEQRIKKENRIKYPEWACYMNWKKSVHGEGFKPPITKKYGSIEKNMKNDKFFQECFLPLFDKLDKNEEGEYLDPVWNIKNGWHRDEILTPPTKVVRKGRPQYSMSVDRKDSSVSHLVISNLQIVSWKYNDLKGHSTDTEREVMANYDNIR
mgnify:CR=1 FL=1|tara:strand:+ start:460 stop:1086 length:627 start_codon:yes stop_codon:yes gene_type:complete